MIQPLQLNSNISFRATTETEDVAQKTAIETEATVETEKQTNSLQDKFEKTKKGAADVIKGFNNVTNVTGGTVRGVIEGTAGLIAVGVFAKNLKDNSGHLFKTIGGTLTDAFKGIGKAIKFIPNIITKSPLDNVKTLASLPKNFYCKYMKGHSGAATIATAIGLGILAYRSILGKIHANNKNANLDHKLNRGHTK